jgi:hypothetical protein
MPKNVGAFAQSCVNHLRANRGYPPVIVDLSELLCIIRQQLM